MKMREEPGQIFSPRRNISSKIIVVFCIELRIKTKVIEKCFLVQNFKTLAQMKIYLKIQKKKQCPLGHIRTRIIAVLAFFLDFPYLKVTKQHLFNGFNLAFSISASDQTAKSSKSHVGYCSWPAFNGCDTNPLM